MEPDTAFGTSFHLLSCQLIRDIQTYRGSWLAMAYASPEE